MKFNRGDSMNISQWLDELKRSWEQHDVEAAVSLFTNDVEYFETPFSQIDPARLYDLWKDIYGCIDTKVECELYATDGNRHSVIWHATWKNTQGELQEKGGTYLVTLNDEGKCSYFYRTSMPKEVGL